MTKFLLTTFLLVIFIDVPSIVFADTSTDVPEVSPLPPISENREAFYISPEFIRDLGLQKVKEDGWSKTYEGARERAGVYKLIDMRWQAADRFELTEWASKHRKYLDGGSKDISHEIIKPLKPFNLDQFSVFVPNQQQNKLIESDPNLAGNHYIFIFKVDKFLGFIYLMTDSTVELVTALSIAQEGLSATLDSVGESPAIIQHAATSRVKLLQKVSADTPIWIHISDNEKVPGDLSYCWPEIEVSEVRIAKRLRDMGFNASQETRGGGGLTLTAGLHPRKQENGACIGKLSISVSGWLDGAHVKIKLSNHSRGWEVRLPNSDEALQPAEFNHRVNELLELAAEEFFTRFKNAFEDS